MSGALIEHKTATIDDLPINIKARLSSDQRVRFIKLLDETLANRQELLQADREQKKSDIVEKYKKVSGWIKLRKQLDTVQAQESRIKEEMIRLGIAQDGNVYCREYNERDLPKTQIEKLLEALDKNSPDRMANSKLKARLLVASTVGEALVIMRSVLGNGILPSISVAEVKALPQLEHQGN